MADADSPQAADDGSEDYTHLFRSEGFVSDVDLRVDVAENLSRVVGGNEDIVLKADLTETKGPMTVTRGARTRVVDEHRKVVHHEETIMANRVEETVHGGVHHKALFAVEAIVGGAYANTIAGPYLRLAGWVDFLAWGGWAEIDTVRSELSLLMIRSHVGYAHAALLRVTVASRLVDDFQTRTENFMVFLQSGTSHTDAGAPGGGVTNEA